MVSAAYNRNQKSKIYSLEKARSLGMGEGVPLKKGRNIWEKRALMVHIIVKVKDSKKFLIVYFHLRFCIT